MKSRMLKFIVLILAVPRLWSDAVLDWNAIAVQTILAGGRPGPSGIIDCAVAHAAIHDAVQAYDRTFEPYVSQLSASSGDPAAAVAQATRDVLVNRFPAQTAAVDAAFAGFLAANSIPLDDPGLLVGAEVAADIIAARVGDGAFPSPSPVFAGSEEIGMWRPTPSLLPGPPPSGSTMAAPWIAVTTPFVIQSATQFAPGAPYSLKSGLYAKEYNETKSLGELNSTTRTPAQTQLAYFYADNFISVVNRLLRGLAQNELEFSGDRARLLALAWLTAADGLITAWESKLQYPTWRPITAIREGENDGNRKTIGDPDWQPLVNTPNYPDQCSGANTLVGGVTQLLKMFFDTDKMTFTVTSAHPNANPTDRIYRRFSDLSRDVVNVRIYQGIHFRSADLDGRQCGKSVARYVFRNALRPLEPDRCRLVTESHDDDSDD
jgi:hypothetical protein